MGLSGNATFLITALILSIPASYFVFGESDRTAHPPESMHALDTITTSSPVSEIVPITLLPKAFADQLGGPMVCRYLDKEYYYYDTGVQYFQGKVDDYLHAHPGNITGAQAYLSELLKRYGEGFLFAIKCIKANGGNVSSLTPIRVPELDPRYVGGLAAAALGGVVLMTNYVKENANQLLYLKNVSTDSKIKNGGNTHFSTKSGLH